MHFDGIIRSCAVATGKGGVGKTMLATTMTARWAKAGHRVLLIDCDGQANATIALGLDPEAVGGGGRLFNTLLYDEPLTVEESPGRSGLDVVPAGVYTGDLVTWLAAQRDADERVKNAFRSVAERYDRLIFDCPPSVVGNRLAESVLANAQCVISPCTDQLADINGLEVLGNTMQKVNSAAVIAGVVLVRVPVNASAVRRFARKEIERVLGSTKELFEATVRSAPLAWRQSQEAGMLPGEFAATVESTPVDIRARIAGKQEAPPRNLKALADDLDAVAGEAWARLNAADRAMLKLGVDV